MKFKAFIAFSGVFLVLSLNSTTANAANVQICKGKPIAWRSDRASMYISRSTMPEEGDWSRLTLASMSEWSYVGGANFLFYYGRYSGSSTNLSNGRNEITFGQTANSTALAETKRRRRCSWSFGVRRYWLEADVVMSNSPEIHWSTDPFSFEETDDSIYNFPIVMQHELGHVVGLSHFDESPASMNTTYFNSGPNGHYDQVELHGDDRYGLRVLYPDTSPSDSERDVSVSRYRVVDATHSTINRMQRVSGTFPSQVVVGTEYDIAYTLENLGSVEELVTIRFYASRNSYISSYDTELGQVLWSMPAGSAVRGLKRVTIPASLQGQNYYFGYRADPSRVIPESNEINNFVSNYERLEVLD